MCEGEEHSDEHSIQSHLILAEANPSLFKLVRILEARPPRKEGGGHVGAAPDLLPHGFFVIPNVMTTMVLKGASKAFDERSESRKGLGCGIGIIALVTEKEHWYGSTSACDFAANDNIVSSSLHSSSNLTFQDLALDQHVLSDSGGYPNVRWSVLVLAIVKLLDHCHINGKVVHVNVKVDPPNLHQNEEGVQGTNNSEGKEGPETRHVLVRDAPGLREGVKNAIGRGGGGEIREGEDNKQ